MSQLSKIFGIAVLVGALGSANATYINFINLADNVLGEGPIATYTQDGITITFTAVKGLGAANAYLDFGTAGLGVCGDLLAPSANKSTNECNPSSDDNVTTGEAVTLTFNRDVKIDKAWYNNNHDGGLDLNDQILVNGVSQGVVNLASYGGKGRGLVDVDYFLSAGSSITYAFKPGSEEFYLDAMDVQAVPEPATLGLFGLGLSLFGFAARRRRNKA